MCLRDVARGKLEADGVTHEDENLWVLRRATIRRMRTDSGADDHCLPIQAAACHSPQPDDEAENNNTALCQICFASLNGKGHIYLVHNEMGMMLAWKGMDGGSIGTVSPTPHVSEGGPFMY